MDAHEKQYRCAVEAAMDFIGGKWKGVIVYHLLGGTKRFGELRKLIPDVTQRMLTLHLREMERDGLVHREVYREVPPRVEYRLTPFGETLKPVLQVIQNWGHHQWDQAGTVRAGSGRKLPSLI
jgi:DNA-binding HxlR family transcriptional regulator